MMRQVTGPPTDASATEGARDGTHRPATPAFVGMVLDRHHHSPPDAWLSGGGTLPR